MSDNDEDSSPLGHQPAVKATDDRKDADRTLDLTKANPNNVYEVCVICKKRGHTSFTCQRQKASELGVLAASGSGAASGSDTASASWKQWGNLFAGYKFERQPDNQIPALQIPTRLTNHIQYHGNQVTTFEFHPTNNSILVSGDRFGQLGLWNFSEANETIILADPISNPTYSIRFHPFNDGTFYSASDAFTLRCTGIETNSTIEINIKTGGPRPMGGRYSSLEFNPEKQLLMVGDGYGILHMVDSRTNRRTGNSPSLHTMSTSILGIHCHPFKANIFLTCGSDHYVKLWDVRKVGSAKRYKQKDDFIAASYHEGPVNSAYFSPHTGSKIVATCRENYIRIFSKDDETQDIAHSHGNATVLPFKAEWDPRDVSESVVVIGRYRKNGVGKHPVDFIDTCPEAPEMGNLLAELTHRRIKAFCPVNKIHPREHILATASGRSLFIWKPRGEADK